MTILNIVLPGLAALAALSLIPRPAPRAIKVRVRKR
jgi:hypothetical protein